MSWLIKQATRRESFSDQVGFTGCTGNNAVTKFASDVAHGVSDVAHGASDVAHGAHVPKSTAGAMENLSPGKMQDISPSFEVGSELWKSRAEVEREQREAHALSAPDYALREEEKEHERDSEAGSELISEFSVRRSKQRARSVQAATIASISPHAKHPPTSTSARCVPLRQADKSQMAYFAEQRRLARHGVGADAFDPSAYSGASQDVAGCHRLRRRQTTSTPCARTSSAIWVRR